MRELREQHAQLEHEFGVEKARANALAAALCNALERLGQRGDVAGIAARPALV